MPSYQAMFRGLIDVIGPRPGEAILEIGCGAGSLVRLLAKRLGPANPITAADINPFLLHEAAQLTDADELAVWHAERDRAEAEGLLFVAHPLHCAVGTKPSLV